MWQITLLLLTMGGDGGPDVDCGEAAPLLQPGVHAEPASHVAAVPRPHRDVGWARFYTAFQALAFILGFVAVGKQNKDYNSLTTQSSLAVRRRRKPVAREVPTLGHASDSCALSSPPSAPLFPQDYGTCHATGGGRHLLAVSSEGAFSARVSPCPRKKEGFGLAPPAA